MVSSKKPNKETTKPRSDDPILHHNTRSSGSKSKKPSKANNVKKQPEVHEISESSSTGSVEEVRGHESKKGNGVVMSKGRNGKGGEIPVKRKKKNREESVVDAEIRFPMNRIRRIMREDNSTPPQIMQDAVFLVNKATEMFIAQFSEEVYESSVQDKKKFIHYKHLSSVVSNDDRYEFLAESVPEKLKADVALEEWEKSMADAG